MNVKKSLNLQIYSVGFMVLGVMILYFSSISTATMGVSDGIKLCLGTVIPSLFPFMVISSFIVESGLVKLIAKPIALFSEKILKVNPDTGAVFFMSLIGGYPTGAKMLSSLVEQNKLDQKTAKRIIPFCISAGPGFIITAVGMGMFGSTKIGLLLFLSQTIANIILGILSGIIFGEKQHINRLSTAKLKLNSVSNSFVNSVASSAHALLNISAFITIFSGLTAIMMHSGILDHITNILTEIFAFTGMDKNVFYVLINGALEVVQGCLLSAKISGNTGLYICSFFLSFSGLSILFQVISCAPQIKPKLSSLMVWRIFHALIASTVLFVMIKLNPTTVYTLSSFDQSKASIVTLSGSPEASAMLFFLCSFFLFSLGNIPKKT